MSKAEIAAISRRKLNANCRKYMPIAQVISQSARRLVDCGFGFQVAIPRINEVVELYKGMICADGRPVFKQDKRGSPGTLTQVENLKKLWMQV